MTKFLELTIGAMKKRKNNRHSYEYSAYQFLSSTEFDLIVKESLPLWVYNSQPDCFILGMCLKELVSSTLKDALVKSKRNLDPTLFEKQTSTSLTKDEKNSEVNRHFA